MRRVVRYWSRISGNRPTRLSRYMEVVEILKDDVGKEFVGDTVAWDLTVAEGRRNARRRNDELKQQGRYEQ